MESHDHWIRLYNAKPERGEIHKAPKMSDKVWDDATKTVWDILCTPTGDQDS